MKVRLRDALAPHMPVVFASSEYELLQLVLRPAQLIVIHGVPPFADARLPARVRHATRGGHVPLVVLASSREPAWRDVGALIESGQVEDVIRTDTERMDALIAAWSLHSDRCQRMVAALRLVHECAPEPLHGFLEELLLNDSAELSVSAWAARTTDGSRFTLHRELAKEGVSPSTLVDVARVLNVVTRVLLFGARLHDALAVSDMRAARRLLARTLGMTPTDVTLLARDQGPQAVRDRTKRAVREMLRRDEWRDAARDAGPDAGRDERSTGGVA